MALLKVTKIIVLPQMTELNESEIVSKGIVQTVQKQPLLCSFGLHVTPRQKKMKEQS